MSNDELTRLLEEALAAGELDKGMDGLAKQLDISGATIGSVETILKFMEAHPEEDYGERNALKNLVERFYRRGYEDELLKSLARKPTLDTVLLLGRLVNGAKDSREREFLLAAMRAVQDHPAADEATSGWAEYFLASGRGEENIDPPPYMANL